jgi:hypothetical protein
MAKERIRLLSIYCSELPFDKRPCEQTGDIQLPKLTTIKAMDIGILEEMAMLVQRKRHRLLERREALRMEHEVLYDEATRLSDSSD